MTADAIAPDVSSWQVVMSTAYPRRWITFRHSDGDYLDPHFAANLAVVKYLISIGRMDGFAAYHVYRPASDTVQDTRAQRLASDVGGSASRGAAMLDVESWSGAIRGDQSASVNRWCLTATAALGGNARRVKGYGNKSDLASLWPGRLAQTEVIVAKYSSVSPTGVLKMVGWQYTDGAAEYPVPSGCPRSTVPFGACDHNIFPGTSDSGMVALWGLESVQTARTTVWTTLAGIAAAIGVSATVLLNLNGSTNPDAPIPPSTVVTVPARPTFVEPSPPITVIPTPAPPITSVPSAPSAPSAPAPAAPAAGTYTVKRTDSDGLAAAMRRIGVSNWQAVAALNGLRSPYPIRVGQVLRLAGSVSVAVPVAGSGSCTVTVRSGDTLSRLDPSNWRADAALNGIRSPYVIRAGEVIRLAKCAAATPAAKHAAATKVVTVLSGQTLSGVAAQHGMSLALLLAYNPGYEAHPGSVRSGARITVLA